MFHYLNARYSDSDCTTSTALKIPNGINFAHFITFFCDGVENAKDWEGLCVLERGGGERTEERG